MSDRPNSPIPPVATTDLTRCSTWNVWVGRYTNPVLIVAPLEASMDDVALLGRVAMLEKHLETSVRPGYEEFDTQLTTDNIAREAVTKMERGVDAWLDPKAQTHDFYLGNVPEQEGPTHV
jgi:hypothetical protein